MMSEICFKTTGQRKEGGFRGNMTDKMLAVETE